MLFWVATVFILRQIFVWYYCYFFLLFFVVLCSEFFILLCVCCILQREHNAVKAQKTLLWKWIVHLFVCMYMVAIMVRSCKRSAEYQLLRSRGDEQHPTKCLFQLYMMTQKLQIHQNHYCVVVSRRDWSIGRTSRDRTSHTRTQNIRTLAAQLVCFFSFKNHSILSNVN